MLSPRCGVWLQGRPATSGSLALKGGKMLASDTGSIPILDSSLTEAIATAKVLMVGAGGIGCELLKNLVLSGFRHVEIVDLDTIELSNLNRQFLFRRKHIGQSKAHVAREAALRLVPSITLVSYHASIKDTARFDFEWFRDFDLVMTALDNIDARQHVNRMCLATGRPLIESGTAGYFGQATVIKGWLTECYECQPKPIPTTYPVCTIRSTPSTSVHCIVWAKEFLFANLFGPVEDAMTSVTTEGMAVVGDLWERETEAFGELRKGGSSPEYIDMVFTKIFDKDIECAALVEELWKERRPPQGITLEQAKSMLSDAQSRLDEEKIWPLAEWIGLFFSSLELLRVRSFAGSVFCPLQFDKDDDLVIDLIASATNIRAHIYSIPLASRFKIKSVAGNIIPAIATTNAIAASLMVLHAYRVLEGKVAECMTNYIQYGSKRSKLLSKEYLCGPSPGCTVCQVHRASIKVSTMTARLGETIGKILGKFQAAMKAAHRGLDLDFEQDDICVFENNRVLFDADLTANAESTLENIGITSGSFLHIEFGTTIPLVVAVSNVGEDSGHEFQLEFNLLPPELEKAVVENRALVERAAEDAENLPPSKRAKIDVELIDDDVELIN